MKGQSYIICALLVLSVACSTCYSQPTPKAKAAKPGKSSSSKTTKVVNQNIPQANTMTTVPEVPTVPVVPVVPVTPSEATQPNVMQPGATEPIGAGPAVAAEEVPVAAMTVDANYVYVLRGNKLYKYNKSELGVCSTSATSSTTAALAGAGPCPLPYVPAISAAGQQAIACLQSLCGYDADKAYLAAMIQSQSSIMAISQVAAVYAGSTSLQDFATNAAADSCGIISALNKWQSNKFCIEATVCPAATSIGNFDICNPSVNRGRDFDVTYMNQALQYYVDEIALSQIELQNGKDCDVKKSAYHIIKDDQAKVNQLRKWLCKYK